MSNIGHLTFEADDKTVSRILTDKKVIEKCLDMVIELSSSCRTDDPIRQALWTNRIIEVRKNLDNIIKT